MNCAWEKKHCLTQLCLNRYLQCVRSQMADFKIQSADFQSPIFVLEKIVRRIQNIQSADVRNLNDRFSLSNNVLIY
jgi:hypothetical protein